MVYWKLVMHVWSDLDNISVTVIPIDHLMMSCYSRVLWPLLWHLELFLSASCVVNLIGDWLIRLILKEFDLSKKSGNYVMILISYECNRCVLGVDTISGMCFGLEISENGQKRRYRVTFEPTRWRPSKQGICHYLGSPWTSLTLLGLT